MRTLIKLCAAVVIGIGIGTVTFAIYQHYQNPADTTDTPISTDIPTAIPTATPSPTPVASISTPASNTLVKSPISVKAIAPNTWFFEGQLPVQLIDANGTVIAHSTATPLTDWETTGPVSLKATLTFTKPGTSTGTLVIRNNNSSDLATDDVFYSIPVRFR